MADRIERYLGRLEAELEGRVPAERIAEILLEVENHLRESEKAYLELGEPSDLANRLALEEFGGEKAISELQPKMKKNRMSKAGYALIFGVVWVLVYTFIASMNSREPYIVIVYFMVSLMLGAAYGKYWRTALAGIAGMCALTIILSTIFVGAAWHPVTGTPILQLRVDSESKMLVGGQFMPDAKDDLENFVEKRDYILAMQNYMTESAKGLNPVIPKSESGYLIFKNGGHRWADSPDVASYKNTVGAQNQSLHALNMQIDKMQTAIALTYSVQGSTVAQRVGPLAYCVVLFGCIGAIPLFVFGFIGRLGRLMWDRFAHGGRRSSGVVN